MTILMSETGVINAKIVQQNDFVQTFVVKRELRLIALTEVEIEGLGSLNLWTNVSIAVSSAFLSFAFGIFVSAKFTEKPTPEATTLSAIGIPILTAAGLAFLMMAVVSGIQRHRRMSRLVPASRVVVSPTEG